MIKLFKLCDAQMMRRRKYSIGMIFMGTTLILSGCFHEQVIPVTAEFIYTINNDDYSTPAYITVENTSKGATHFLWTFEGGEPSTSSQQNPGPVTFLKAGDHSITLEAWNDDERKTKKNILTFYDKATLGFDIAIATNNISPVSVAITNTTVGGTAFRWVFDKGDPNEFIGKTPPVVRFIEPGTHTVILIVDNGPRTDSLVKKITVLPGLAPAFEIAPSFDDDDFEAPLRAALRNESTGGLNWYWTTTGGQINDPTAFEPEIYFDVPGTYTITLQASNGKDNLFASQQITVKPNTNLRTIKDIVLGINTAHETIGSFYSTTLRNVVKKSDVARMKDVDIAFFGLNENFGFNKFVSPDSVENYTFSGIEQAQVTHFINSLDQCACGISFSEADFDQLASGETLDQLAIVSTLKGLKPFDDGLIPRVVLFETQDHRKGAIKINDFIRSGFQSYILFDIKIQKE